MNWGTIRPALKTLLAQLTGISNTVWEDEPRPFMNQAICLLSITASSGMGRDETRPAYDATQAPGQELQDQVLGVRAFTLTVKVESQVQTDTGNAYQYLEDTRDRLFLPSTRKAVHLVNCAIVEALPTVDLGETRDSRRWSIAALDIKFAARTSLLDPARYGYMGTAPVTGTLT